MKIVLSARRNLRHRECWRFCLGSAIRELRSYQKTLPVATPSQYLVENPPVIVKFEVMVSNLIETAEDGRQEVMMTDSTTILETKRLLLRRLTLNDVDALFELYRDPEVRRYFPEGTLTYEETKAGLAHFLKGYIERPTLGFWATIDKETGAFIGRCGINPQTIEGRPELEVGYLIGKAYWRQGLGGEAAQAIVDYGFDKLGLSRLICTIDPENQASIKVAMKIGMTFEREAVDEYGPFLLYSRSK